MHDPGSTNEISCIHLHILIQKEHKQYELPEFLTISRPVYLQISLVHEIFGAEYFLAKSSFHKKYHWHLKCWTNHNPSNTQLKLPHAAVKNCTNTIYIIQVAQFIDQLVRCKPRTRQVTDLKCHVLLNQIYYMIMNWLNIHETHKTQLPKKLIITIEKKITAW